MSTEVLTKPTATPTKPATEKNEEPIRLTTQEIIELMAHDSHRRVKGKIRQQRWADY